uniref:Acyl-CoA binding domain containing 4 n=1 Tax=Cyprinodon variegatus TaxID=28743 RepID=A0A3Q2CRQ2_CYPVA
MPVLAMAAVDHQRRFQAAVDVIHNLPKTGSYRPSYEVMLRFYSLYKQAVCGPCTAPRPGFWDPVGRYKWDAWSRLGEMSQETAMAAYVEEMKKVAQEVINTMPMDQTAAGAFRHFEPLYRVIDDMPRPPASLFDLAEGGLVLTGPVQGVGLEKSSVLMGPAEQLQGILVPSMCKKLGANGEMQQFLNPRLPQAVKSNGFHSSSVYLHSSPGPGTRTEGRLEGRRVGAGQGGEGAEDGRSHGPPRRGRDGGIPQGNPRRGAPGAAGGGVGGFGGGDGSEGGAERIYETHLQQQIILALRRLREDMRSVMDRLEAVERLAATHEEAWWPFDVSCQTVLLFMLWPFVAQGLVYLLRKAHQRSRTLS